MSESSAASEQFSGHGSPAAATWVSHYNITWVDIVITAHLLSLCHIIIPRLVELSTGLREISQCLFRLKNSKIFANEMVESGSVCIYPLKRLRKISDRSLGIVP